MKRTLVRSIAIVGTSLLIALAMTACGGQKPSVEPAFTTPIASPEQPAQDSSPSQADTADSTTTGSSSPGTSEPSGLPSTTPSSAPKPGKPTPPAATAVTPTERPGDAPQAGIQHKIGELVFTEGSVSIHRAGATPERADIGSVVRAYDVLVTGPKSRAEIDIASGSSGGASIKLAENTAFYFDTKELSEAQRKTVLQLLSGSLAIKVDKLANGSFQVGTDSAILGVRGTVFIVDTVPDGSLLVSCETGAVSVSDGDASSMAKPGEVVQMSQSGGLQRVDVQASELASYRGGWRTDAYEAFASKALTYTSSYAIAIEEGKPAFDTALARLLAQKPTLDAWRTAKGQGKTPRFTDWIVEKKAVSSALFDCLKALFALERPYYRLIELKALHAAGTGVGKLSDGRSSAAYFSTFDASTRELSLGMARVREALVLFSWASAGSPLGDLFGSKAQGLGTSSIMLED